MKKPTKKSVFNKKAIAVYSRITIPKTSIIQARRIVKDYTKQLGLKYKERSMLNKKGVKEYNIFLYGTISLKKFLDNTEYFLGYSRDLFFDTNLPEDTLEYLNDQWSYVNSEYSTSTELIKYFKSNTGEGFHKDVSNHLCKFIKKNKIYQEVYRSLHDFFFFIEADDLILFKKYFDEGLEGTILFSDMSNPQKEYDRYVSYMEGMFSKKSDYLNAKNALKKYFNNKYIKYLDTYEYKEPKFRVFR